MKRTIEPNTFAFYDVSRSVKSWGRRGVLIGAVFGFALGVGFVAIPFTSDVLTFGVIGTLVVAAIEGGVIAGAFAVCIAAFYGKGDIYRDRRRHLESVADSAACVNVQASPTVVSPATVSQTQL